MLDQRFNLLQSGNYRDLIDAYSKAIELNPKYAEAYYGRRIAYQKLGNTNMVIQNLKIAAKLGYKQAQTYVTSQGIEWR